MTQRVKDRLELLLCGALLSLAIFNWAVYGNEPFWDAVADFLARQGHL